MGAIEVRRTIVIKIMVARKISLPKPQIRVWALEIVYHVGDVLGDKAAGTWIALDTLLDDPERHLSKLVWRDIIIQV